MRPMPTDELPPSDDRRGAMPNRSLAASLALGLIGVYRHFVSPALPPACRFVPSCSEYGYEAIAKYGIIKGGRLAAWRILRCNPFSRGGYDPVRAQRLFRA